MKRFFLIIVILFCSILISFGDNIVLERSQAIKPQWVDALLPDYIITTAMSGTIEDARQRALEQVKEQIVLSVASHVDSETKTTYSQSLEGDDVRVIEETVSSLSVIASNIPFIKGISSSNVEEYYWEKVRMPGGKSEYRYSVKYPFSEDQLQKLIAEFMVEERKIDLQLDSFSNLVFSTIDELNAAASDVKLLMAKPIASDPGHQARCTKLLEKYKTLFLEVLGKTVEMDYKSVPSDGCKIFSGVCGTALVSIVTLNPKAYTKSSDMSRVAVVKSTRQVSEFLNGALVKSETDIVTDQNGGSVYDKITIQSFQQTKTLELLKTFVYSDTEKVFVFIKREP